MWKLVYTAAQQLLGKIKRKVNLIGPPHDSHVGVREFSLSLPAWTGASAATTRPGMGGVDAFTGAPYVQELYRKNKKLWEML